MRAPLTFNNVYEHASPLLKRRTMRSSHLCRPLTKLAHTRSITSTLYIQPTHTVLMRPDVAFPYRPSAAVPANFHSPPASPLTTALQPEEFAHVITELQDPATKQGRKDTLLALLGLVREVDDPATRAKPVNGMKDVKGQLDVEVETEGVSAADAEAEEGAAEGEAQEGEAQSKRVTYTITGETGRPCPRERLMG